MVTANTNTSKGDSASIMYREPPTVMRLDSIWVRSLEREALTVSTS